MEASFSTKALILRILRIRGRSFGFEILDELRRRTSGMLSLSTAHIYPALKALAEEGLIEAVESDEMTLHTQKRRAYYMLTNEGKRRANLDQAVISSLWTDDESAQSDPAVSVGDKPVTSEG